MNTKKTKNSPGERKMRVLNANEDSYLCNLREMA